MIPKILHYCWFGGGKKSELIIKCIATWEKYMPEYEIVEWNEKNFDININTYVKEAYINKKWAFVSDYVRAYALYQLGGIYLDTDVEIRASLTPFLMHGAFSGFEKKGFPFTAVWGAEKEHNWVSQVLDYYNELKEFTLKTNTEIVSEILIQNYKINIEDDTRQVLDDNIYIYPSSYFCLNLEKNFAVHHFEGSWLGKERKAYADLILHNYYKEKLKSNYNQNNMIDKLYNDEFFTKKEVFIFLMRKLVNKFF